MKTTIKAVAILLAITSILTCIVFSIGVGAVDTTSSNSNLEGGQTVYITTNPKWSGGSRNALVSLTLPIDCRDAYCEKRTGDTSYIQITTFKKIGTEWVEQKKLSGKYTCNPYSGLLSDGLRLPGKDVEYKLVITPECNDVVRVPSDMSRIQVSVSYGTVTNVQ